MSALEYRAEVGGAVLPVILYRSGVSFVSGVFAGVGIFFVISGYLIPAIVISELQDGRFTLRKVYERRAIHTCNRSCIGNFDCRSIRTSRQDS